MASARVMGLPINRWHAIYDFLFLLLLAKLLVCDCKIVAVVVDDDVFSNGSSMELLLRPPKVRKLDSMNFISALYCSI